MIPKHAIQVEHLTVSYGGKPVLVDISLEVPAGSVVGILGPNGAGKSTLIKALMGFVRRDFGEVVLFGKPVEDARGHVAYVPQRGQIDWSFPVTVWDVVLMGRYMVTPWYRSIQARDRELALIALEQVRMTDFRHRQIGQLSGGQQQRVFMARALAQQSPILLLDEPFAGVDAATERAIAGLLKQSKAEGKTVMVVHHDLETAAEFFDRVVILNRRLYAYGEPAAVLQENLLAEVYGGKLRTFSWNRKE
ncbi:MAG: metal ABC transporter ATP-binding protein [Kiritimatiellia bacterium]|jgi:manganese/iron transport system ATP-binding protein/manganese/zinc/iron transport system ATP- binding protein|nr:metal ABC transporter ATP-binding protein [Kiritimatiellia bacterium]